MLGIFVCSAAILDHPEAKAIAPSRILLQKCFIFWLILECHKSQRALSQYNNKIFINSTSGCGRPAIYLVFFFAFSLRLFFVQ